eukprot:TRINITY_DN93946_c0_g1_i1.p1 TRINITY_DN93946_c0_g1~~TRINITY_DN93946_c0_g1_i1.p1  ORF type:complete len:530 (+),score=51.68 TRINITY_DN93946_c0_g1_i1:34-1590(+)
MDDDWVNENPLKLERSRSLRLHSSAIPIDPSELDDDYNDSSTASPKKRDLQTYGFPSQRPEETDEISTSTSMLWSPSPQRHTRRASIVPATPGELPDDDTPTKLFATPTKSTAPSSIASGSPSPSKAFVSLFQYLEDSEATDRKRIVDDWSMTGQALKEQLEWNLSLANTPRLQQKQNNLSTTTQDEAVVVAPTVQSTSAVSSAFVPQPPRAESPPAVAPRPPLQDYMKRESADTEEAEHTRKLVEAIIRNADDPPRKYPYDLFANPSSLPISERVKLVQQMGSESTRTSTSSGSLSKVPSSLATPTSSYARSNVGGAVFNSNPHPPSSFRPPSTMQQPHNSYTREHHLNPTQHYPSTSTSGPYLPSTSTAYVTYSHSSAYDQEELQIPRHVQHYQRPTTTSTRPRSGANQQYGAPPLPPILQTQQQPAYRRPQTAGTYGKQLPDYQLPPATQHASTSMVPHPPMEVQRSRLSTRRGFISPLQQQEHRIATLEKMLHLEKDHYRAMRQGADALGTYST